MTLTHTKFQAPFVGLGWQRQSDSVGSSGRTFLRVRATNRAMLALANNYFAILMSAQGGGLSRATRLLSKRFEQRMRRLVARIRHLGHLVCELLRPVYGGNFEKLPPSSASRPSKITKAWCEATIEETVAASAATTEAPRPRRHEHRRTCRCTCTKKQGLVERHRSE